MKKRFIFLLANVAVLAAAVYFINRYWNQQAQQTRQAAQLQVDEWRERADALSVPAPAAPVVVNHTNAFRWSQLESTDYRVYIANLRAVGCPEATVRDIILTDVLRLYAQRRGQFYQNGRPFKYWETDDKRKLNQTQLEDREKQLAQIDKDLPAVLRELLGINYEREMNKYFVDSDEDNRRLSFLGENKKSQLLALREKFEGERERVEYQNTNDAAASGSVAALQKIDQEQEEALSSLLSPEEKEQYQLAMSPTADHLREQLIGFSPTEAEFRDLFRRQQAIDQSYAYQDLSDPSVRQAKAAEEQTMMTQVQTDLGPERAAALDRSKNPDYQQLTLLSQRYELAPETSQAVIDMKQAAEDQRRQLLASKDISPDRVQAALRAIEAETERATRETLGEKAFDQYSSNAVWMRNLSRSP